MQLLALDFDGVDLRTARRECLRGGPAHLATSSVPTRRSPRTPATTARRRRRCTRDFLEIDAARQPRRGLRGDPGRPSSRTCRCPRTRRHYDAFYATSLDPALAAANSTRRFYEVARTAWSDERPARSGWQPAGQPYPELLPDPRGGAPATWILTIATAKDRPSVQLPARGLRHVTKLFPGGPRPRQGGRSVASWNHIARLQRGLRACPWARSPSWTTR